MNLSLDGMYYHQNAEIEDKRHLSLNLLQDTFRQPGIGGGDNHHHPYYSALRCHEDTHQQFSECKTQIPVSGEGIPYLKNWVDGDYPSDQHAINHQINGRMIHAGGDGGGGGCGELESLSLSMSPGPQSCNCITAPKQITSPGTETIDV